jgi:DNA-directed RNA polymerase subunit RPC12/RpoP
MDNDEISCPYCGSKLISTTQKGFSLGKAAVGGVLLGPLGLLAGTHKSKDIMFYCMACQRKFTYEDYLDHQRRREFQREMREARIIEQRNKTILEQSLERDRQEKVILHTPEFEKEQEQKNDPTIAIIIILAAFVVIAVIVTAICAVAK